MPDSTGPLTGLKVLDLSIIVAGGTASSLLADFGAEVIKVESVEAIAAAGTFIALFGFWVLFPKKLLRK